MASVSWKKTLKLPVARFPPRSDPKLRKALSEKCMEDLYSWQHQHRSNEPTFTIHDGPPYANGPLHTGHAVNKILKDMILRSKIQTGYRVEYRPGWDCHGLPIELKAVRKAGSDQGTETKPQSLEIRQKARALARSTVETQKKAFRSFQVMADWSNKWTTMDRAYVNHQLRIFQGLVRKGLVYRKLKPIWWSPKLRTALAEAELEYKDNHVSNSAYIKFKIVSDWTTVPGLEQVEIPLYVAVWTTTPWTLPGNRAVAVHDELKYSVLRVESYALLVASDRIDAIAALLPSAKVVARDIPGRALVGLKYAVKLQGQLRDERPILHGDFVTADSGTGLVHCAPGHGQDDFDLCLKNNVAAVSVVGQGGEYDWKMLEAQGWQETDVTGSPRALPWAYEEGVLEQLKDDVLAVSPFTHRYPHDWRLGEPIVVRSTEQWFVDVSSLQGDAIKALDAVNFVPASGKARLESFVKGRNEWCISRQRSWGVPIPVLYDQETGEPILTDDAIENVISQIEEKGPDAWFNSEDNFGLSDGMAHSREWASSSVSRPTSRRPEVMDVWFDSGVSWTQTQRQADVYLEGTDQYRGWFQSSLLTHVATQPPGSEGGKPLAPFRTLITHGFTLDAEGKKMSKSIGNTVSPEDIMNGTLLPPIKMKGYSTPQHEALGSDALRLWVASSDFRSDMTVGPDVLKPIHTTLLKYRSILKMLIGSMHEPVTNVPLSKLDQFALVQLQETMSAVREAIDKYEFHQAYRLISRWVSVDLSAFYLEAMKDRLYCGDGCGVLPTLFIGMLRMLAPIAPYLVEEAWHYRPTWMQNDMNISHPARELYDSPLIDQRRMTCDKDQLKLDLPVILDMRTHVQAALEIARRAKSIGNSLACSVYVETDNSSLREILARYDDELRDIFVVSSISVSGEAPVRGEAEWHHELQFTEAGVGKVHVLPPQQHRCSRCWIYQAEEEDSVCKRCEDILSGPEASADAKSTLLEFRTQARTS